MILLDILIFAVVVLVVWVIYLMYKHAYLKAQAERLAQAVITDSKSEAKHVAVMLRNKL